MFVEPAKGRLRYFFTKGIDLSQYVHCIRVYYSVCKAYATAQVIIYDNNNLIESLQIVAGDAAALSFDSPPNSQYSCTINDFQVLKMKGEQVPDTLKYQVYYLDLIGPAYFNDRVSTVREVFSNLTGTQAIQKIWGEYIGTDGLSIQDGSQGMIGKDASSYSSTSMKPLTAIADIMKSMVGVRYPSTGSWMIFKDREGVNIAQLEGLISRVQNSGRGQQDYFIQKETWGMTFNDPDLYHAIIVAQMEAGRGDGGRGSASDIAAAASQTISTMDLGSGLISGIGTNFIGSAAAFASGLAGGKFGGGGLPNIQAFSSARSDTSSNPTTKTTGENSYSAQVRNGPQLTLKVPLQTGLNVTVGKGIWAQLMPPTGDYFGTNPNGYLLAGPWLVADLCHELYTDQREVTGSTALQCVKGSLS